MIWRVIKHIIGYCYKSTSYKRRMSKSQLMMIVSLYDVEYTIKSKYTGDVSEFDEEHHIIEMNNELYQDDFYF